MQYSDIIIDGILQDIDARNRATNAAEQTPSGAADPITRFGSNSASVYPGQSDPDLAAYLAAWMRANKRKLRAAALVYAGVLGSTAPKQDDCPDGEAYRAAYAEWIDRCTDKQRRLLQVARERKAEMRRAEQRAEYAQKVKAERGVDVREYVTGLSSEDRTERRRLQNAEKAKRYRARQKASMGKSTADA